jgi:hypothetical protein
MNHDAGEISRLKLKIQGIKNLRLPDSDRLGLPPVGAAASYPPLTYDIFPMVKGWWEGEGGRRGRAHGIDNSRSQDQLSPKPNTRRNVERDRGNLSGRGINCLLAKASATRSVNNYNRGLCPPPRERQIRRSYGNRPQSRNTHGSSIQTLFALGGLRETSARVQTARRPCLQRAEIRAR